LALRISWTAFAILVWNPHIESSFPSATHSKHCFVAMDARQLNESLGISLHSLANAAWPIFSLSTKVWGKETTILHGR
jgi:hypothetical protein